MEEDEKRLVSNEDDNLTVYGSTSNQPEETLVSDKDKDPTENSSEDNTKELNEIYELVGLGPAQYLYWILTVLVASSDYVELTLLSVILPTLRCIWDLSYVFEAATTVAVYGSYAICAVVFGKIADKYGRKPVIKWATIVLMVAATAGAVSPNEWVFLLTRVLTGACVGVNISCIACYCTEFSESRYRAHGSFIFSVSMKLGKVGVNVLAYLLLHVIGWRWFIIVCTIQAVPTLVMIIILPESPRYLCANGQQDKAMKAIRCLARLNGKELSDDLQVVCCSDQDSGSYSKLLSKEHKKSVIALSVIYFSNIFVEYGLITLLPLLFSSDICGAGVAPEHICQNLSQEDLAKLSIVTSTQIVAAVGALILALTVNRLVPLRVAIGFAVLSMMCFFVCVGPVFTLLTSVVIKMCIAVSNTLIWIMMPESFPTDIRSTAIGFINGWGKLGGLLGAGCVYLLFYTNPYALIGLYSAVALIGFISSLVYDRETKGEEMKET
ncbi:putative transporter svop-1 [Bolinopsis microptera]|uniref:putative transporter svop-1 n=1 Tax=Bolinopsis microptera TaxID=2820187 RepID=UPI0030797A28